MNFRKEFREDHEKLVFQECLRHFCLICDIKFGFKLKDDLEIHGFKKRYFSLTYEGFGIERKRKFDQLTQYNNKCILGVRVTQPFFIAH